MALTPGPIVIKQGERLCEPFSHIFMLTSALAYSTIAIRTGSIPAFDPKLGFVFPCTQFPFSIKIPIHGPLEGAINGETVTDMTIVAENIPDDQDTNVPSVDMGDILMRIIAPVFSHYYERQAEWLSNNVSGDPNQLPMIFRFCRTVRNAVVHRGLLTIQNANASPVNWRGLSYSAVDNGRVIYNTDMNTGDFLALMIEVDQEMNQLNAPSV